MRRPGRLPGVFLSLGQLCLWMENPAVPRGDKYALVPAPQPLPGWGNSRGARRGWGGWSRGRGGCTKLGRGSAAVVLELLADGRGPLWHSVPYGSCAPLCGHHAGHKRACFLTTVSFKTAWLDMLGLSASPARCVISCTCTNLHTCSAAAQDPPGFLGTTSCPVVGTAAVTDGWWHINYLSVTQELWEGSLHPAGGTAERIPSARPSNTPQE